MPNFALKIFVYNYLFVVAICFVDIFAIGICLLLLLRVLFVAGELLC